MMEIVNEGSDERTEFLEAQAHVWRYTLNYITSMSLKCAVQLGIPDILSNHSKPLTLSELVNQLSIPQLKATHVHRLMRILVHSGFFAIGKTGIEDEEQGYVLTPSSKLFLKKYVTNMSPFVSMITDPVLMTPFQFLSAFFQSPASTAMEEAHGTDFWGYCEKHPEFNKCFNEAMASDADFLVTFIAKDCKMIFESARSLVDVGGGTGNAARAISEALPNLEYIVLDLPHVVSDMKSTEKIKFVAGDMFESIPCADIVLLKWIMHDWGDEECIKILQRCREAIPSKEEGGKVVLIDMVVDEKKGDYESLETQLCFDMLMMAILNGKERTKEEWKTLFLKSGFTSYTITYGLGLRSIIEVFP